MTRKELLHKVKARLDELIPFDTASVVFPQNELLNPLETLIEEQMDEATLTLLRTAPLHLLSISHVSPSRLSISPENIGYISMPPDFLRLAYVLLRGWKRPVTSAIGVESPTYKLQRNIHTCAGNAKPVIALVELNLALTASWQDFVCQNTNIGSAWANNTYEVARTLLIANEPRSVLAAFEGYAAISSQTYQRLAEADRQARVNKFLAVVGNEFNVVMGNILRNLDRVINNTTCPITANLSTITVASNNITLGTTNGGGTYNIDTSITVRAIPTGINRFVRWTENGVEVSTSADYTFTTSTDRVLVAEFEYIQQCNITVTPNNLAWGTASGAGLYSPGGFVIVTATPTDFGHRFVRWTENGVEVSTIMNYSFIATTDRVLVAEFEFISATYTVNVSPNNINMGSVSGTSAYYAGTLATLNATPKQGYNFVRWTENGVELSRLASYSFIVDSNHSIVGEFEATPVSFININGSVNGQVNFYEPENRLVTINASDAWQVVSVLPSWLKIVPSSGAGTMQASINVSYPDNSDQELIVEFRLIGAPQINATLKIVKHKKQTNQVGIGSIPNPINPGFLIIATSQYPVASNVSIEVYSASSGFNVVIEIPAGETRSDEHQDLGGVNNDYVILDVNPSQDNTYIYVH